MDRKTSAVDIELTISDEVHQILELKAKALGLTLEEYVRNLIVQDVAESALRTQLERN